MCVQVPSIFCWRNVESRRPSLEIVRSRLGRTLVPSMTWRTHETIPTMGTGVAAVATLHTSIVGVNWGRVATIGGALFPLTTLAIERNILTIPNLGPSHLIIIFFIR